MRESTPLRFAGFALAAAVLCGAVLKGADRPRQTAAPKGSASQAAPSQGPTPATVCARCHALTHSRWTAGRHSKMLQLASAATVLGDFSGATVVLRNVPFTLTREEDRFLVRGVFPAGKEESLRVEF